VASATALNFVVLRFALLPQACSEALLRPQVKPLVRSLVKAGFLTERLLSEAKKCLEEGSSVACRVFSESQGLLGRGLLLLSLFSAFVLLRYNGSVKKKLSQNAAHVPYNP
jgi:hypothetical protein